jgi:hypothetical protein
VVYQGYLYEIGGYNSSTLQNVEFAPINSNGTVGSWTYSTNLEQVTHGAASVAYDGYLYEIGGEDNSNNPYNTIEYAEFSSGGGLVTTLSSCPTGWTLYSGTWCYGNNNLPNATKLATAVAYNGYAYNIGGYTTAATNVVDYAQINANGSLGTWSDAGNDLPAATYKAASVIYNGYIYEIGGVNSSGNDVSTVEYAPINSNGTLGSWTVTTSLPIIMDYPETTAYDGYLYEVAGYNSSSAPVATVYYAPINTNGTIGSWTQTTNFSTALYDGDTLAYNGYLYQIGGANSSGTAEQTVDYTSLSSIPRVGDYSDLINLASSVSNPNGDVDPYEIIANGTNAGNQVTGGLSGPGGIVTQYAIADNTCTALSALQAINTGVSGQLGNAFKFAITTNGCSTATNLGSYLWLRYLLDDSQTATFPDVNGNHTTVNNFTVYFNPNSTYRLRDGATFDNGTLQSLDTEP